jgi:hypothetical protein
MGDAKGFLTMFVRKKKNRSGSISVIVAEKTRGKLKEIATIGIAKSEDEVEPLIEKARSWIAERQERIHPTIDFEGRAEAAKRREREEVERVVSSIENVLLNGCELILDRVFDLVGFSAVEDKVFRQLVHSRLSYPASKAATVDYLKNHFDEDVDLSRIYRYLDKLNDRYKETVQDISVRHTMDVLGGHIGVVFYDVTTV